MTRALGLSEVAPIVLRTHKRRLDVNPSCFCCPSSELEGGKQKAESRRQKAEGKKQKAHGRRWKVEGRKQKGALRSFRVRHVVTNLFVTAWRLGSRLKALNTNYFLLPAQVPSPISPSFTVPFMLSLLSILPAYSIVRSWPCALILIVNLMSAPLTVPVRGLSPN